MKKWVLVAVFAVVLGAAYLYFFKRSDIIDTYVEGYIEENTNVPITLVVSPELSMKHNINSYDGTVINSDLKIITPQKEFSVPLISNINRGTFTDDGQIFDYAHITTQFDTSSLNLEPPFSNPDLLSVEHFVDSGGMVRGKYRIKSFDIPDNDFETLHFGQSDIVLDHQLVTKDYLKADFDFGGIQATSGMQLVLKPISADILYDDNRCEMKLAPFDMNLKGVVAMRQGTSAIAGSCRWNKNINSLEYDLKGTVDGLAIALESNGINVEFLSGTTEMQFEERSAGVGSASGNIFLIPEADMVKQFGVDVELNEVSYKFEFNDYDITAVNHLVSYLENSSEESKAKVPDVLKQIAAQESSASIVFNVKSSSGDLTSAADLKFADRAENFDVSQIESLHDFASLLVGDARVAVDNQFLQKTGLGGLLNMLAGRFLRIDTENNQTIVDAKLEDGEVRVNGLTLTSF